MTKANWELAPHDAETYEQFGATSLKYCKPGYCWEANTWVPKAAGNWTILEHRPRIIAWEDMKEGMVVRCVEAKEDGNWYRIGELCDVSTDEAGDFGPLNTCGDVTPCPERYTFELVSETEQDEAEREEEVWTHISESGNKCKLVNKLTDGREVFENEMGIVWIPSDIYSCGVEPIRPTITKSQAWDMAAEDAVSIRYIKEHNNIID